MSANLLNNDIGAEQARNLAIILKGHATLKSLCGNKGNEAELDMSGKKMGAGGAMMLAPEIVANGALTSVNILSNYIGADQAIKLIAIMASKPNLTTLCGFSGDETELDLSNKNLSAGCAVLVANEVKNNGALETITSGDEEAVTMNADMAEADFNGKRLGTSGAMILAAFLPKCR